MMYVRIHVHLANGHQEIYLIIPSSGTWKCTCLDKLACDHEHRLYMTGVHACIDADVKSRSKRQGINSWDHMEIYRDVPQDSWCGTRARGGNSTTDDVKYENPQLEVPVSRNGTEDNRQCLWSCMMLWSLQLTLHTSCHNRPTLIATALDQDYSDSVQKLQ